MNIGRLQNVRLRETSFDGAIHFAYSYDTDDALLQGRIAEHALDIARQAGFVPDMTKVQHHICVGFDLQKAVEGLVVSTWVYVERMGGGMDDCNLYYNDLTDFEVMKLKCEMVGAVAKRIDGVLASITQRAADLIS